MSVERGDEETAREIAFQLDIPMNREPYPRVIAFLVSKIASVRAQERERCAKALSAAQSVALWWTMMEAERELAGAPASHDAEAAIYFMGSGASHVVTAGELRALCAVIRPARQGGETVTEQQIKYMVDRFLSWKLPADFHPDAGISFKAEFNEGTPWPMKHEPVGTNLFSATQAEAMIRHLIDGMPASRVETLEKALTELVTFAERDLKRNQDEEDGGHWSLKTEGAINAARAALAEVKK